MLYTINVFYSNLPDGCCERMRVSSPESLGEEVCGTYTWTRNLNYTKGGKPFYERDDGIFCILFLGHCTVGQ